MILVALVCVLHPALSLQQGPEWDSASPMSPVVKRALAEQPHWRFTGTREVTFRRGADVLQHAEYITRDGWNLRIDFPADSRFGGQVIVETSTDRRHFDPKKNEIHVSPPRREPLIEHIRGAWRGDHKFRMVEAGGDRVAGLSTRLVSIVDSDGNRIQDNIEPKFGIVLARRIYDDVGTQIASFTYKEIDLHPNINPNVFELRRRNTRVVTPEDDLLAAIHDTQFLPLMIPPEAGLVLDSVHMRKIAGQSTLMSHYIAPKGWVTLFQLSVGVDPKTLNQQAPKHIHTATVQIQGRWFVAVGVLSEAELSDAIHRLREAQPHPNGHPHGHHHGGPFGRF